MPHELWVKTNTQQLLAHCTMQKVRNAGIGPALIYPWQFHETPEPSTRNTEPVFQFPGFHLQLGAALCVAIGKSKGIKVRT